MQIGLEMIKVSHHKAKRAVGTRSGNISRIYMNIWRSEENKSSLRERHTDAQKNKQSRNSNLYLYKITSANNLTFKSLFIIGTLMQEKVTIHLRPSLSLKTTISPFKNVWNLNSPLLTSPFITHTCLSVKGLTYLFSVEARQREWRWAWLPKIQPSGGDETVKWLRGPMR